MNLLAFLPWLAFAATLAALSQAGFGLVRKQRPSSVLPLVAALTAAASFVALAALFLDRRVAYENVFLYTQTTLAWWWRLAGAWTGRDGSLLLWGAWTAGVTWLFSRSLARKEDSARSSATYVLVGLLVLQAVLLWMAVESRAFRLTPESFLSGRPQGNGLNPTLRSGFMLIHPPLMFLAYAMTAVPCAAALAHLATGTPTWSRATLVWTRVNWLLYTAAMSLGGMWAYYTLGFGGYWAWDPVEVANLLPWLALTVYLHAQLHHARFGRHQVLVPLLGVLPFLLTVFSTLSTRSGLWVSVHAFTDPTNAFSADIGTRSLALLAVEPGVAAFWGLWLCVLLATLALLLWRNARDTRELPFVKAWWALLALESTAAAYALLEPRSALSAALQLGAALGIGHTGLGCLVLLLGLALLSFAPVLWRPEAMRVPRRLNLTMLNRFAVAALGLGLLALWLFHMAALRGWSTAFYERRFAFLVTPGVLGLIVLEAHGIVGRRRSLYVAAASFALAFVAAWWRGTFAYLAVLGLVWLAFGFQRTMRAARAPGLGKARVRGHALVLVAAMLDVLFWLDPPSRIGWPGHWVHVTWPVQALVGPVALLAVGLSLWRLSGSRSKAAAVSPVLVALLGGFYVAAPLAVVGWLLSRKPAEADNQLRARVGQATLYGFHMVLAIALLGYAASTYAKDEATVALAVGESATVGPATLTFVGTAMDPEAGTPYASVIHPGFDVAIDGKTVGRLDGVLAWERSPGVDAHLPLPATWRTWDGDVYLSIHNVALADGPCPAAGENVTAYEPSARVCTSDRVESTLVGLSFLPGLGLMWTAVALLVGCMGVYLWATMPETRRLQAKSAIDAEVIDD